jgi:hypothetical protein
MPKSNQAEIFAREFPEGFIFFAFVPVFFWHMNCSFALRGKESKFITAGANDSRRF